MKSKVIVAIGLCILLIGGLYTFHNSSPPDNGSPNDLSPPPSTRNQPGEQGAAKQFRNEDDWMGAYLAVQKEVRKRLSSSSNISFPWNTDVIVQRRDTGQNYDVESYAEVRKSTGEITKIYFTAEAHQDEDDRWTVHNLELDR